MKSSSRKGSTTNRRNCRYKVAGKVSGPAYIKEALTRNPLPDQTKNRPTPDAMATTGIKLNMPKQKKPH